MSRKIKKSKAEKGNKKQNEVNSIVHEIRTGDEILKRNTENKDAQVYMGLLKSYGYSQNNPMPKKLLERMEMDLEETRIKLEGMEVINPAYKFQTDPRWVKKQVEMTEKHKDALVETISQLNEQIEEIEKALLEQNERIKERKTVLLDRLKQLKADISEFEKPPYIG